LYIQQNIICEGGFQTATITKRSSGSLLFFRAGASKELLPMLKRICSALIFLLLWAALAVAQEETGYITDTFQVTLRTGPGIDHTISAMLRSGQPLTVLEEGEEWTLIELPDERQGYVLTRFISQAPPARLALDKIRTAYDALQTRAQTLATENERLLSENRSLQTQLKEIRGELSTVEGQYTTLKSESSDFFSLKKRYERTAASLRQNTERVQQLEAEVSRLELRKNIRWFLSGAGVLVLGFLIGFSAKKQRRRSSLL
jgi:SH3 domain protein